MVEEADTNRVETVVAVERVLVVVVVVVVAGLVEGEFDERNEKCSSHANLPKGYTKKSVCVDGRMERRSNGVV